MHLMFLMACSTSTPTPAPEPAPAPAAKAAPELDEAKLRKQANALFGKLPDTAATEARPVNDALVDLGKRLYFDTRLSANDQMSCNTCHQLDNYGVDGEPTSPGVSGKRGDRNSPTVYNAALHMAQFWDGREPDVEAQALGPILNPVEMEMADEGSVLKKLKAIDGYNKAFAATFDDGLTYRNIGVAIGAFERTLLTPAPFDAWLGGDDSAMTMDQKLGLKEFLGSGCGTCHNGPLLGGKDYQKLGVVHPWEDEDMGRFQVTKDEADKQKFKVPSLRNIEKTGPYYHDGSVADLGDAIRKMGHHQLGLELEDEQVQSIQTFLGALTGELDPDVVRPPEQF